ncbi:MAG: hypothetical protein RQ826_13420 [Xanthomonadales bacterium]|nr:hypothetical protein [Xanthomonadales bacterium]
MLKATLETLEGLDENLHELYEETDNGFKLNVSGVESHPDVLRLKKAYDAEREKRKESEAKLREIPEDFDPDQWKNVKSGKAKEEDLIKLRKELEGEIDQWKEKAQSLEKQTYQMTVSQQLDEALAQSGITNPAFQKAARALLKDGVTVKDGKAIVDTDMGPMELQEHVKRWVSSEGQAFVEQPKGGGSKGSKGSEPRDARKFNEIPSGELSTIRKENPEEYERLKSEYQSIS